MRSIKLVAGIGSPEKGACWTSAISYYAGEKWSDHPDCVCPVIAKICIAINNRLPDDESRGRLIGPRLLDPMGTSGDHDVMIQRAFLCADVAVRVWAADALDAAGVTHELRNLAPVVDAQTARAARAADSAARAADATAARARALADSTYAADAVARARARADSAYAAADAAAAADSAYAAADAAAAAAAYAAAAADAARAAAAYAARAALSVDRLFTLLDRLLAIGNKAPIEQGSLPECIYA